MAAVFQLVQPEQTRSLTEGSDERLRAFLDAREIPLEKGYLVPGVADVLYEHLKERGPWTEERLQRAEQAIFEIPRAKYGETDDERQARKRVHREAILEELGELQKSKWLWEPLMAFSSKLQSNEHTTGFVFLQRIFLVFLTTPLAPPLSDGQGV